MRFIVFLPLLSLVCGCDSGSDGGSTYDHFLRPTSLTVEIDYEPGGEPYGGVGTGSVFKENVDALFPFLGAAYTAPASVGAMENIGAIADESLTTAELLALADQHRDGQTVGSDRHVYVLFVDGYWEDDSGIRKDILGISIGNSGIIAMFKPVIEMTGTFTNERAYAEQTVLVHEFGHDVGLVDNGIAMQTAHVDTPHGAHCTNDKCIMYYTHHAGGDLLSFVTAHMGSSSNVLFDANCLADVRAHYGN